VGQSSTSPVSRDLQTLKHPERNIRTSTKYFTAAAACFLVGAIVNAIGTSTNALALSEALLLAVFLFLIAAWVSVYRERRR
jgi:hypothetical protein